MRKGDRSMIAKIVHAFTGRLVAEAKDQNCKTAKSLKDAIAEARAKADAEAIEQERLERVGHKGGA